MNSEAEAIALAREHLACNGWLRVPVTSSSMAPMMRPGDWVWVEAISRPLRVGDIVMVDVGGKAVIHRLIYITQRYLILQGDAVFRFDVPITPGQAVGIVVARERKGRRQEITELPLRLLSFLRLMINIARAVVWQAWKGF